LVEGGVFVSDTYWMEILLDMYLILTFTHP